MGFIILYFGSMRAQWMRMLRLIAEMTVASGSSCWLSVEVLAHLWLMGGGHILTVGVVVSIFVVVKVVTK